MTNKDCKKVIYEVLDDTVEGLYYRLFMDTDLDEDAITGLINEVLADMDLGLSNNKRNTR